MPRDLAGEAQVLRWSFTALTTFPNLLAYRARCTERPAWKRTFDAYCQRVEAAGRMTDAPVSSLAGRTGRRGTLVFQFEVTFPRRPVA